MPAYLRGLRQPPGVGKRGLRSHGVEQEAGGTEATGRGGGADVWYERWKAEPQKSCMTV